MPVIYERAEPILKTPTESKAQLVAAPTLTGEISLDRISYRYAPDLPLALDQVSFTVAPGEQVAVVGPPDRQVTLVRLLLASISRKTGRSLRRPTVERLTARQRAPSDRNRAAEQCPVQRLPDRSDRRWRVINEERRGVPLNSRGSPMTSTPCRWVCRPPSPTAGNPVGRAAPAGGDRAGPGAPTADPDL